MTNFSDSGWTSAKAGFGTEGAPGAVNRTTWNTHNIWLRQEFTLGDLSNINKDNLVLYIHHDDECEVYINGVKAAQINGAASGYAVTSINESGKKALIPNGKNVTAIHCHQGGGGQYIDAGISLISFDKPASSARIKD